MVDRLSKGCPRLRDYEEKEYIELSEGDPRLSSDDDDDDIVQVEKNFLSCLPVGIAKQTDAGDKQVKAVNFKFNLNVQVQVQRSTSS
jgi:hypothetical protein